MFTLSPLNYEQQVTSAHAPAFDMYISELFSCFMPNMRFWHSSYWYIRFYCMRLHGTSFEIVNSSKRGKMYLKNCHFQFFALTCDRMMNKWKKTSENYLNNRLLLYPYFIMIIIVLNSWFKFIHFVDFYYLYFYWLLQHEINHFLHI